MSEGKRSLHGVILDFASLGPEDLDLLKLQDLPVEWTVFSETSAEQVMQRIAHADVVLTNKVVLDEKVISKAGSLRYIGVLATGMNNIDLNYCRQRKITVQNVEAYGTPSVAQHTLLLMLLLATSATRYLHAVEQGRWQQASQFCLLDFPITELADKHLVIVGYGELGQAVANLAKAFGMQVSIAQRPDTDDSASSVDREPLDELLPRADFVSLHCALSAQTEQMFNADRLALIPAHGFLINTARGGLVDELALLNALQNKQLAGAAVDVVSTEPPPEDHPLLTANLANLIVTPHIAWAAQQSRQRLLDSAVEHLRLYISDNH